MRNLTLYQLAVLGPWGIMGALYALNIIEASVLIPIFVFYYFIFRPIVDFNRLRALGLAEPKDKFKLWKLIKLRLEHHHELINQK